MALQRYIVMPAVEWVNGAAVPLSRAVLLTPEQARYDLLLGRIYLDGTQPPPVQPALAVQASDVVSLTRGGLSQRVTMAELASYLGGAGGLSLSLSSLTFQTGVAQGAILAAISAPANWPVVADTTFGGRVAVSGSNLVAAQAVGAAAIGTVRLRATSPDGLRQLIETFPVAFEVPPDVVAPVITSPATFSAPENSPYVLQLTASEAVTWSKTGGADAALFTLDAAAATLTLGARDFEAPVDGGTNNTYAVEITATDAAGNPSTQTITGTVTNVLEGTPATLIPLTATILTTAASPEVVLDLPAKVEGEDRSFAPNDGRFVFNTAGKLIRGLTAITAGTVNGTITRTRGGQPLDINPVTITVNTVPVPVFRGGGYNTSAFNLLGSDGATQWSFLDRHPYQEPHDFSEIEVVIPLWTLNRAGAASVLEADLPEAYDFEIALEYPFANSSTSSTNLANRTPLLASGQVTYSYVPGQAEKVATFKATLPTTIPANTPFGLIMMHECVAGRSGGVTNKRIIRAGNASIFSGKRGGGVASTSALKGTTMTCTIFTADTASPSGISASFQAGLIRTKVPVGKPAVYVDGNSIEEGSNEGTGFDQIAINGDASGDAKGNKGWATRFCSLIGVTVSNVSRGGDRDSYRAQASGTYTNYARRLELLALANPTHIIDMNPHNDIPTNAVAWSAATIYALDDVVVSGARGYIVTQAGTSGTTAPAGTGKDIVDGGVLWTYLGENDFGSQSLLGIQWVGNRRKRIRKLQAVAPNAKLIGVTETPDGLSIKNATSYTYDSTLGKLYITMPSVSGLAVGGYAKVSGLTPSTFNNTGTSYNIIQEINGNVVTLNRATGLGTPTGTLALDTFWSSVAGQQPATNYTAGNSYRTWVNRFLRAQPWPVLPYAAIADISAAIEAPKAGDTGPVLTAAAESGAWLTVPTDGIAKGNNVTNDGTHPTSLGNDLIAQYLAQNTALVAIMKSVS